MNRKCESCRRSIEEHRPSRARYCVSCATAKMGRATQSDDSFYMRVLAADDGQLSDEEEEGLSAAIAERAREIRLGRGAVWATTIERPKSKRRKIMENATFTVNRDHGEKSIADVLLGATDSDVQEIDREIRKTTDRIIQLKRVRRILVVATRDGTKTTVKKLGDRIAEYLAEHGPTDTSELSSELNVTKQGTGSCISRDKRFNRKGNVVSLTKGVRT